MARCMLGNLPSFLWGEVVHTAIHTLNRCPTKAVEGKTPYEAWTGKKPNLSHFRIFGCDAFAFITSEKRKKLDKRSEKCIFVGYDNQHRGYRLYSSSHKIVFISRDVKFNELSEDTTSHAEVSDTNDSSPAPNWLDDNVYEPMIKG